jgi:hypothetical protein
MNFSRPRSYPGLFCFRFGVIRFGVSGSLFSILLGGLGGRNKVHAKGQR